MRAHPPERARVRRQGDRPLDGPAPRPQLPSVALSVVRPGLIEISREEGVKESRPTCSLLECAGFRVLVDLAHPKEGPETLLAALKTRGLRPADIHAVLFTHLHPDHIGHKELFSHALFVFHEDERLGFYFEGDRTLRLGGSALLELGAETFSRPRAGRAHVIVPGQVPPSRTGPAQQRRPAGARSTVRARTFRTRRRPVEPLTEHS